MCPLPVDDFSPAFGSYADVIYTSGLILLGTIKFGVLYGAFW